MIPCQSEFVYVRDNVSGEYFKEIPMVQVVDVRNATYAEICLELGINAIFCTATRTHQLCKLYTIHVRVAALSDNAMFRGVFLTGETLRKTNLLDGWKKGVVS